MFIGNTAKYGYTVDDDDISLGKGGGESIIFKGFSANNVICLQHTNITNNMAYQGGGIYLALHDHVQNNSIKGNTLHVLNNTCYIANTCTMEGGGAFFIKFSGAFVFGNTITVSKSTINHNKAPVGGGIFMSVCSDGSKFNNYIAISDSDFHYNSAQYGVAMYLYSYTDTSLVLDVLLWNLQLTNNAGMKLLASSPSYICCTGIICIDKLLVVFSDAMSLNNNNASAIELHHHASLLLSYDCHLSVNQNKGERGGAIALYECSYIVLQDGIDTIELSFDSNTANVGGAIYSSECSLPVCFIQHSAHVDYEKWNVFLSFWDNTAKMYGSAMYISNTVNCWPSNIDVSCSTPTDNADYNISKMFCWDNWQYSPGNCYDNINTSALYYTSMQSYSVYPGDTVDLELRFYDQQMQLSSSNEPYEICINGLASFYDTSTISAYPGDNYHAYGVESGPENCKSFNDTSATIVTLYFAPDTTAGTNCIDSNIDLNITLTVHVSIIHFMK